MSFIELVMSLRDFSTVFTLALLKVHLARIGYTCNFYDYFKVHKVKYNICHNYSFLRLSCLNDTIQREATRFVI